MNIFTDRAFVSEAVTQNFATQMKVTHDRHMLPPDSPFFGSPRRALHMERTIGADSITGAGTFQHAMLQALDDVSAAQRNASELSQQALLAPDTVDIHDITIAQAQASMALDITRNVLNRLVQGWRDLINTR